MSDIKALAYGHECSTKLAQLAIRSAGTLWRAGLGKSLHPDLSSA